MAQLTSPNSGRGRGKKATDNLAKFGATKEYGPDEYEVVDDAPSAEPTRPAADASGGRGSKSEPTPAASSVPKSRRTWVFNSDLIDDLEEVKSTYLLSDRARFTRLQSLSEQAFVTALLRHAIDDLNKALAVGADAGFAGELESLVPDNARGLRKRR